MKAVITGGAGFIGSNLASRLAKMRYKLCIIDNLSNGKTEFLKTKNHFAKNKFYKLNLLTSGKIKNVFCGNKVVYHLSANSNIQLSSKSTSIDFRQTLLTTYLVLEATRLARLEKFIYTSGSGVYGDLHSFSPKESYGPLFPVSMYGATKLGAEAMISAYSSLFGIQCFIFRFANVVGPNQTHGVAIVTGWIYWYRFF